MSGEEKKIEGLGSKKCPYCGKDIKIEAQKCKHCKKWLNKDNTLNNKPPLIGYCGCIVLFIIVCGIIFALFSSINNENDTNQNNEKTYKMGKIIDVGYTSYLVNNAYWTKWIGNVYFGKTANANFLLINITVHNNDKEAREVPPFCLIDENGSKYETSADSIYLGDQAFLGDSLNPGVEKSGFIVFDVPSKHTYKLEVSGGYWSDENALVDINGVSRERE